MLSMVTGYWLWLLVNCYWLDAAMRHKRCMICVRCMSCMSCMICVRCMSCTRCMSCMR